MKKEIKSKLLLETLMVNVSLFWWKSEMKKVLTAIEVFESNIFADPDDHKYAVLQGKLAYLIKKGNFESRALTVLKKKISELP